MLTYVSPIIGIPGRTFFQTDRSSSPMTWATPRRLSLENLQPVERKKKYPKISIALGSRSVGSPEFGFS